MKQRRIYSWEGRYVNKNTVIVAGDVTMDWNIATSQGTRGGNPYWSQEINSTIFWQRGGAAQRADLVEAISKTPPPD